MEETWEYWPDVKGGKLRKQFRFSSYGAIALGDFEPFDDEIQYLYIIAVFELPEKKLCPCVASELSQELLDLWKRHPEFDPGGNAHILGLFTPQGGPSDLGVSSDWADIEKFTTKALDVARSQLKVRAPATEEPLSGESQNSAPAANAQPTPIRKPWWRSW